MDHKTRAAQLEALREEFRKHGIRKAKLGGFDVDGVLRGKYVSLEKFWGAAEGGLGFCDVIFGWDLGDQLYDQMAAVDLELEAFHTETGPGVYEAAIRYDAMVRGADKAALFKTAAKEICARHGVMPTFMAKWNKDLPGCSGHLHESLWTLDGQPVFLDPRGYKGMSKTMQHYVAGQVALLPAMTALIAPTINSYKRMVRGAWSPTLATWGVENRTTALRVIPGSPSAIRVEYRLAAADMNPYIAMAASVASGLYGIEHELPLPVETEGNGYDAKVEPLPATLREATARLSESKEARDLLGSTFVDHYVRTREWECRQFEGAVTRWELERYFEII